MNDALRFGQWKPESSSLHKGRNTKLFILGLAKQTLISLSLLIGILFFSFFLFNIAPNDPARVILGPNASEEAVENLRSHLGTDRPLWEQWKSHVLNVSHLDFGRSIVDGRSVSKEVLEKFLTTAKIGGLAALLALLFSYLINLVVYYYPSARLLINLANIGIVTPTFFVGVIAALIFGVWLPIVPLSGYSALRSNWVALLLPAFIASLYPIALMTRLLHEKILAASAADYARAAYAFGFRKWHVFHQTLLRPVAVSWLATWVNQLSIIFIASYIIEVIFTIPGVGSLLITTIQRKDYPMLQGILLINAMLFITITWLSELIFGLLDPRVTQDVAK